MSTSSVAPRRVSNPPSTPTINSSGSNGGSQRLVSLDAYRGFVMLAMASGGFGIVAVAKHFPDNPTWQQLAHQFDHVPWIGSCFWDMIQPSFMFMVGVACAFSYAARQARGDSYASLVFHAAWRAVALTLLGIFLRSNGRPQTNFTFDDVTTQIGLGYFFLFLLWGQPRKIQAIATGLILVGYWALFFFWPLPPADYDWLGAGINEQWQHLPGHLAHWEKNANPAHYFDVWFMNLFPRPEPFKFSGGGYQTLSFIPSLATMIFGLMTGDLLRSNLSGAQKWVWLMILGVVGVGVGYAMNELGICPVVKRIWTPSWAIYSTGWALILLATFYAVVDLAGQRWLAFPFVVVGSNSIAIYCMTWLIAGWIISTLTCHLGAGILSLYQTDPDLFHNKEFIYKPMVTSGLRLLVYWLICLWMYRRKIFLRI